MLHNVKGIVLRSTKYTDNSLIVNVYTDLFGLQTYMTRGVHSRSSKVKVNYFQGLTLLEMVVTKTEKNRLERINEITAAHRPIAEFDFVKNSIALFLNELLHRTIREEEVNSKLFEFLVNVFNILGLKESDCANFHLVFMLKYTQYLGFYPSGNYSDENNFFDLMEGRFTSEEPHHVHYLAEPLSKHIYDLLNTTFETCEQVKISNSDRKKLISCLLDYYRLHNTVAGEMVSHTVLEQL